MHVGGVGTQRLRENHHHISSVQKRERPALEVFKDGTRNLSFKFYSTKQIGMCSGTSKEEQEFFIILFPNK